MILSVQRQILAWVCLQQVQILLFLMNFKTKGERVFIVSHILSRRMGCVWIKGQGGTMHKHKVKLILTTVVGIFNFGDFGHLVRHLSMVVGPKCHAIFRPF